MSFARPRRDTGGGCIAANLVRRRAEERQAAARRAACCGGPPVSTTRGETAPPVACEYKCTLVANGAPCEVSILRLSPANQHDFRSFERQLQLQYGPTRVTFDDCDGDEVTIRSLADLHEACCQSTYDRPRLTVYSLSTPVGNGSESGPGDPDELRVTGLKEWIAARRVTHQPDLDAEQAAKWSNCSSSAPSSRLEQHSAMPEYTSACGTAGQTHFGEPQFGTNEVDPKSNDASEGNPLCSGRRVGHSVHRTTYQEMNLGVVSTLGGDRNGACQWAEHRAHGDVYRHPQQVLHRGHPARGGGTVGGGGGGYGTHGVRWGESATSKPNSRKRSPKLEQKTVSPLRTPDELGGVDGRTGQQRGSKEHQADLYAEMQLDANPAEVVAEGSGSAAHWLGQERPQPEEQCDESLRQTSHGAEVRLEVTTAESESCGLQAGEEYASAWDDEGGAWGDDAGDGDWDPELQHEQVDKQHETLHAADPELDAHMESMSSLQSFIVCACRVLTDKSLAAACRMPVR